MLLYRLASTKNDFFELEISFVEPVNYNASMSMLNKKKLDYKKVKRENMSLKVWIFGDDSRMHTQLYGKKY